MLPTVRIDQRVLVDRIGMDFSSLHVGDIIVFHPPKNYGEGCANPTQGQDAAGRRPASPAGCRGSNRPRRRSSSASSGSRATASQSSTATSIRNGKREPDSYIVQCDGDSACSFPQTITIPRGYYYMMGDNRPDSEDSRFWGPVPRSWIIGKAFLTYWPPDRIGFL